MTTRYIPGSAWTEPVRKRRVRKKARECPTEHQEATALSHWRLAHLREYPELRNVVLQANGEEREGKIDKNGRRYSPAAQRLKEEGLEPGTSDYFLAVARGGYHGFWVELKALDGRPSPAQISFLERMRKAGYMGEFAYGWEAAKDKILQYLNLPTLAAAVSANNPEAQHWTEVLGFSAFDVVSLEEAEEAFNRKRVLYHPEHGSEPNPGYYYLLTVAIEEGRRILGGKK